VLHDLREEVVTVAAFLINQLKLRLDRHVDLMWQVMVAADIMLVANRADVAACSRHVQTRSGICLLSSSSCALPRMGR
jgi:hypothetical protein